MHTLLCCVGGGFLPICGVTDIFKSEPFKSYVHLFKNINPTNHCVLTCSNINIVLFFFLMEIKAFHFN